MRDRQRRYPPNVESNSDAALPDGDLDAVKRAQTWAKDFVAPRAETWETERRFAREAFDSAGLN